MHNTSTKLKSVDFSNYQQFASSDLNFKQLEYSIFDCINFSTISLVSLKIHKMKLEKEYQHFFSIRVKKISK